MAVVKVIVDFHFQKVYYIGELKSFDEKEMNMVRGVDAVLITEDLIKNELSDNFDQYVTAEPCPDRTEADYETE